MSKGMLSLNEVMQVLDLDKQGVESLIRENRLNAYKIGGTYLRFSKQQVAEIKKKGKNNKAKKNRFIEVVEDFWAFNNFYIITALCLGGLLYFALR